jgi:hypothetical protein
MTTFGCEKTVHILPLFLKCKILQGTDVSPSKHPTEMTVAEVNNQLTDSKKAPSINS